MKNNFQTDCLIGFDIGFEKLRGLNADELWSNSLGSTSLGSAWAADKGWKYFDHIVDSNTNHILLITHTENSYQWSGANN